MNTALQTDRLSPATGAVGTTLHVPFGSFTEKECYAFIILSGPAYRAARALHQNLRIFFSRKSGINSINYPIPMVPPLCHESPEKSSHGTKCWNDTSACVLPNFTSTPFSDSWPIWPVRVVCVVFHLYSLGYYDTLSSTFREDVVKEVSKSLCERCIYFWF